MAQDLVLSEPAGHLLPPSTLRALAKQMYETGHGVARWSGATRDRYRPLPSSSALTIGVLAGSIAGLYGVVVDSRLLRAGFLACCYLALIIGGSLITARSISAAARLRLPMVLAATHLAWGRGAWWSMRRAGENLTLCLNKCEDCSMPLVRIDVQEGRTSDELRKLADTVQDVMLDVFAAPPRDRYQIITEHDKGHIRPRTQASAWSARTAS